MAYQPLSTQPCTWEPKEWGWVMAGTAWRQDRARIWGRGHRPERPTLDGVGSGWCRNSSPNALTRVGVGRRRALQAQLQGSQRAASSRGHPNPWRQPQGPSSVFQALRMEAVEPSVPPVHWRGAPPAEAPPGQGSAKGSDGLGGPGWGSSRGHSPVAPEPVAQNIPGVPVGVPLLWALTGTSAFQ